MTAMRKASGGEISDLNLSWRQTKPTSGSPNSAEWLRHGSWRSPATVRRRWASPTTQAFNDLSSRARVCGSFLDRLSRRLLLGAQIRPAANL